MIRPAPGALALFQADFDACTSTVGQDASSADFNKAGGRAGAKARARIRTRTRVRGRAHYKLPPHAKRIFSDIESYFQHGLPNPTFLSLPEPPCTQRVVIGNA